MYITLNSQNVCIITDRLISRAAMDGESDPVKRAEQIENAFKSQEEQLNKLFALLEAKRSFIDQLTLDEDESPIDADLLLGANPDQQ
jgi:hypothetical protein